jgi:hypothetical protein
MAQVTLKSDEIQRCLLSLLKRLAEAISWVSQQGRAITFEVPDQLSPIPPPPPPPPLAGSCRHHVHPKERADAEILVGILKEMKKRTGSSRSKPRSHR